MSRHLWNASRAKSEDPSRRQAEPHLGIFTATVRAVKGLAGRPAPPPQPPPQPTPVELDLPVPRAAPEEETEPPPLAEETTQELPRYDIEPTEPALSMLSRGRHGTLW